MSIAVLNEVYQETRRLAIAGSSVAPGDFRLQKLVAPLQKAGEKAPVFAKVADAITALLESQESTAAGALLELATLVTAILYTQGKTGLSGDLAPIETSGFALPSAASGARVLKPLIEALTSTGSGRLEVIQEAHQRGMFRDLRLVRPALAAIDDVYAEIGDFVTTNILPIYGRAILPDLRSSWDLKGKKGDVRRLQLMHQIAPEETHSLVEQALEEGSRDMKIAAISCLKNAPEHLSYLIEQAKARHKDVRRAAYHSLAGFEDSQVIDLFIKAISRGDVEVVSQPVSENRSDRLLEFLLDEGDKRLAELLTLQEKAQIVPALESFTHFLGVFRSRSDERSIAFLLKCFEHRVSLSKVKATTIDGENVNLCIASLLAQSESEDARRQLVAEHATLNAGCLTWSFIAALRTLSPQDTFKSFSSYYTSISDKARGQARDKREAICTLLSAVTREGHYVHVDDGFGGTSAAPWLQGTTLDPAWLSAAIKIKDVPMACALALPQHAEANKFLASTLIQGLKAKGDAALADCVGVLDTMARVEHPETVDFFLKFIDKFSQRRGRHYYLWWLARIVPQLPPSAAPQIEAALPNLPDAFVDEILPCLETLKTR